ncbi:glycosyltransferase [candidate division GN15 bacterium]|nr:glycosyltransferase [candidate division GN15 bacterium]
MSERRVVIFGWAESVHVQRWATGLAERGYPVRVVSLDGSPIDGIDTQIIPRAGKLSYLTRSRRAARLAREFNPDIVHVHYAGGFSLWGLRTGFTPTVVSVWGADVIDLPARYWHRLVIGRALSQANGVSATSEMLREQTEKRFPRTRGRIRVIPFGVEVPGDPPTLPDGPIKLCYIKRHLPKYGPEVLLSALAQVHRQLPEIRLTMAGEGELTEALKHQAGELGLTDAVDFVGFVDNRRIYSLLQEHHIMVMPSIMESESFGVAVLEAGACARPVIASRVGGVPEVVRDGETGLLVEPGDVRGLAQAIIGLAEDRGRCAAMGAAGHAFVREAYSWERSLDLMSEFYEDVISQVQHDRA